MSKPRSKTVQIRLLLPAEWLPELNNLAASRFLTRLGLIRFYLRAKMDEELATLAEHFKQTEENKATHQRLSKRLNDFQR
jgi:hypothetical protein